MKLCEKTQELVSGYIDQELTQQERQLVRVHIESCDDCRSIYQDLLAIKQSLGNITYPECEEAKVDKILNEPTSKLMSVVGWIMLIVGYVGFLVWQLFTFYTQEGVPMWLKVGVFLIEAGFLLLLGSVLRQRLIANKTDRYNKVKL
ncbi:MAG: zf-HC2 domain-containing protein [Kangiellaceae bacterium]|nr:zf-HC2 domain-containing protein [Kangiellaceae bacterium]